MTAGKTHLMRWMRLYAGGYDLSGDARTFGTLLNNYVDVDLTGWSDAAKNYLAGGGRATGLQGFQAQAWHRSWELRVMGNTRERSRRRVAG